MAGVSRSFSKLGESVADGRDEETDVRPPSVDSDSGQGRAKEDPSLPAAFPWTVNVRASVWRKNITFWRFSTAFVFA